MTNEITEPKFPSKNAEFFKGTAGYERNQIYVAAKRFCEFCVVFAVAPPVLLTIALVVLAVLLTMGRPVLVRRDRVGKGGRTFRQLTFRTRVEGSTSGHWRMTFLGRFLEDSCLAELPQLWNVLVGDMSIVGPSADSPHKANLNRERLPNYELRLNVRPGITGYAQVYLGHASASTRLEYDLYYIRHMGAALDLMIVWQSLFPGTEFHRHI